MAAYNRVVNCDFFRVMMPEGAGDFGDELENALLSRGQVADRNVPSSDDFHRIDSLAKSEGNTFGLFLRLRAINEARVASLNAEGLSDLTLRPNEVLTEFFAFMYVPEFQVVVIHRNRDAGRQGKLERYVEDITGLNPVVLSIVINEDAAGRIHRMGFKSKVELTLARPENMASADKSESAFSLAQLSQESNAAVMRIEVSAGHTKESITKRFVDWVVQLVSREPGAVRAATVRGKIDDEIVLVDLVKDRMMEKVEVKTEGRSLSIDGVYWALRQAYERREGEIRRQYREPKD